MAATLSPLTPLAASRSKPPAAAPSPKPAQLIDLTEVCRRTGFGRTTIQKLLREGKFPPRVKDPDIRGTRYSAAAVEAWIEDRIARATGGR
jgi:predicted DNA-binding transcriptional regulator AlpA